MVFAGKAQDRRRPQKWAAAIVLSVCGALAGCQTHLTSANERVKQPSAATISFCDGEPTGCLPGAAFSEARTREVVIRTEIENATAGNHTEKMEIVQPDGTVYQETRVGFRVLDGSNEPIPGERAIPMANTWIQQRHVTGIWTVRLSLDGEVLATQQFVVKP